MTSETFKIQSGNNRSLSVSKFTPKIPNNKSIVISSATGVLQGYYFKFAIHFSTIGFTVYTFDYSGIGASDSDNLKSNTSNLSDWAIDQSNLLFFIKKENPNHKLTLITHSIGGQLIGLNPNIKLVDNIIMICSQSGYWKQFNGFNRFRMLTFWYALIPFSTPIFNYFPAKHLGLFENLPKQVAYQWRQWGIHPDYLLREANTRQLHFNEVNCNVLSISFPRDKFASKASVDWLTDRFTNATIDRRHIIPEDLNINDVKHFGFFKDTFKDSLWKLTEQWIENKT
ncbi:alpha/beta fold hydrolase [Olleya sp. R77988]|uniref:alpha/beta hydrolase family protein n=1 Tax=Olleya sp. R77988 TaxID=3093875 RepID=UPI0037CAAFA7